jgi:hypothetical protein
MELLFIRQQCVVSIIASTMHVQTKYKPSPPAPHAIQYKNQACVCTVYMWTLVRQSNLVLKLLSQSPIVTTGTEDP